MARGPGGYFPVSPSHRGSFDWVRGPPEYFMGRKNLPQKKNKIKKSWGPPSDPHLLFFFFSSFFAPVGGEERAGPVAVGAPDGGVGPGPGGGGSGGRRWWGSGTSRPPKRKVFGGRMGGNRPRGVQHPLPKINPPPPFLPPDSIPLARPWASPLPCRPPPPRDPFPMLSPLVLRRCRLSCSPAPPLPPCRHPPLSGDGRRGGEGF